MKALVLVPLSFFTLVSCTAPVPQKVPPSPTTITTPVRPTDRDAKFTQTESIVMAMKPNEMGIVSSLYPDLVLTKSVKRGDPDQLAMMGDEEWMYSAKYDVTVVVCKDMNTPAHIFHGKSLSDTEIQKVRKMHEDMMKMMGGSGMMGSGHGIKMESHNMDIKTESSRVESKTEITSNKLTGYIDYDHKIVKEALASDQKVALFFHATWCPTCRAMKKSLTSTAIPSDTLIVEVDYDNSDALKKQYGITSQSTTVVLNSDGTVKLKKIGAMNVVEIYSE